MRKILLASILLSILLVSLASAKDVAYVVKTSENSNIVSALDSLGFSYDIITDSQIAGANFSNYAMLLVQDDVTNKNLLPLGIKSAILLNKNLVPYVWSNAVMASTSGISARFEQLGTQFTEGFSSLNFNAYTTSKAVYYFNIKPSNVKNIAFSIGSSTYGDSIVAYSEINKVRNVFFGFPDASYWASDGKKLFKNSLSWARLGVDFDGDGFYSDSDCNDTDKNLWQNLPGYRDADGDGFGAGQLVQVCSGNSLAAGYVTNKLDCDDTNHGINPNATETAYDLIDNDCKNGDLADVDGDGYCKQGYWIQNRLVQCINDAGTTGTDCNDQNSGINPDAAEIMNNIDENCRNDAPILVQDIENLSFNEDESFNLDLSGYFADYENNSLTYSVYNKSSDIIVSFNNSLVSVSAGNNFNGEGRIIFKASDNGTPILYNISNMVDVSVKAVDDAPVMAVIPEIKIIEGEKAVININATDVDSASLVYSVNDSRFIQNETNKNVFSWQTGLGNSGVYYVLVGVSDGTLSASQTVKVDVLPKILINEVELNPVDETQEFVELYNPSNNSIILTGWRIVDSRGRIDLISHGSINPHSYFVFSETLSSLDFKNNDGVQLLDSGGNLIDETGFLDDEGNNDNTWQRMPNGIDTDSSTDWKLQKATEGLSNEADMIPPQVSLISPENNSEIKSSTVYFNFSVADNAASSLNCSFYSDFAGSFRLVASGIFQNDTEDYFWKSDFVNGNYRWQIKCSDGRNIAETEIRNLLINMPKEPILHPIANITINEAEIAQIVINATDSNPEDSLTYSVTNSDKTNFTQDLIDKNVFTWQTGFNDYGVYYVNVSVSDGIFNASQKVKISVLNKNRAPVLNENISKNPFNEDTIEKINLSEYLSDPDSDALTYKVRGNSNITINIVSGTATMTPKKDWNGQETVIFSANDSKLSTDSNPVTITILAVNDAPVFIGNISNQNMVMNQNKENAVNLNNYFKDVDSQLVYSYSLSGNLTMNITNGSVSIYPDLDFYGKVDITFYASDENYTASSNLVIIDIKRINKIPIFNDIFENIEEDSEIQGIVLNATDPDPDGYIENYSLVSQSSGVKCEISDSRLYITPNADFFGISNCRIKATDNLGGEAAANVTINVSNINDAPKILDYSPRYNPIIAENGSQTFSVAWKDNDTIDSLVSVNWYIDDKLSGGNESFLYTARDTDSKIIKVVINDTVNWTEWIWQLETSKIPVASTYKGNTTDFSQVSDLTSVNLILENLFGRIEFLEPVDLTNQVDFDNYAAIDSGLAAIDTNYFNGLAGKLANITLKNLNFDKTPTIYYNPKFTANKSEISQACPAAICRNVSYENGTINFQAGFSSFKIGETLTCSELSGFICSSDEKCQGTWLNALESRCCPQPCVEIPPGFSDAERCWDMNDSLGISIDSPDSEDEFYVGDELDVGAEITNNADEDIRFTVRAYVYDLTDDKSVKDKKDDLSIDEGDSEDVEFSFNITDSVDESHDYAVLVYAEGEGMCNEKYEKIKINKEDDKILIKSIVINPDSLICGESSDIDLNVKNIGLNDEDVKLRVENSELGIFQETAEFSVKEDKSVKKTLKINVPEGIEPGDYPIEVKALYNGEETSESVTLTVDECLKQETIIKHIPMAQTTSTAPLSQSAKEKSSWVMLDILLIVGIALMILLIILVYLLRR